MLRRCHLRFQILLCDMRIDLLLALAWVVRRFE